jgi:glycosyltransferase involved in cell wall biosynthesis
LVVHTRLPVLAAPFLIGRHILPRSRAPLVILETHVLPRPSHRWVLRRVDLVVTNSRTLAEDVVRAFDLPEERCLHAPLPPYNRTMPGDRIEARRRLGLPLENPTACYTGKLTEEHGDFLLRTAAALGRRIPDCRLVIVGGNPQILDWLQTRAAELGVGQSVVLAGFVAPRLVQDYLAAADVLVLYMPASVSIFPYWTPAKAYEYQAAQRPIVTTDLPLFEEVFGGDGERAIRVSEPTPEAMADGIARALSLGDEVEAMTERAAAWVSERTWEGRVDGILGALGL